MHWARSSFCLEVLSIGKHEAFLSSNEETSSDPSVFTRRAGVIQVTLDAKLSFLTLERLQGVAIREED